MVVGVKCAMLLVCNVRCFRFCNITSSMVSPCAMSLVGNFLISSISSCATFSFSPSKVHGFPFCLPDFPGRFPRNLVEYVLPADFWNSSTIGGSPIDRYQVIGPASTLLFPPTFDSVFNVYFAFSHRQHMLVSEAVSCVRVC